MQSIRQSNYTGLSKQSGQGCVFTQQYEDHMIIVHRYGDICILYYVLKYFNLGYIRFGEMCDKESLTA